MAQLSKGEAQKQLADEVKWWRKNFAGDGWKTRAGWSSYKGNSPKDCDSIWDYDYNAIANQWCNVSTNSHKKRRETTKRVGGEDYRVFKEADKSLSGGKGSAHFIESWSGTQFIWHFKLVSPSSSSTETV